MQPGKFPLDSKKLLLQWERCVMVFWARIYILRDFQILRPWTTGFSFEITLAWRLVSPPEISSSLHGSAIASRSNKQKPCHVPAVLSLPEKEAVSRLLRNFFFILNWLISFRLWCCQLFLHCCFRVVHPYPMLISREWNQELICCNQVFLNTEGLNMKLMWWFSFIQDWSIRIKSVVLRSATADRWYVCLIRGGGVCLQRADASQPLMIKGRQLLVTELTSDQS